ncbi:hypothetical protein HGM15179_015861 [Zosterops borbonicus]|uniref:RNase H type-1 domain-containing protein n=1 Tax=Zosterops borbonicus TaxID=364589 RepID=A0A8K1G495_9PASS|nr:hypothetical protein HGM15179_015861 [Zosterops borbonicus]
MCAQAAQRANPILGASNTASPAVRGVSQNSKQYRNDDMTDPLEGTSETYVQEENNICHDQEQGCPASSQEEERDNWIYWTVWIRWPGTSDPQEYMALVDTGAQCTMMPSRYVGTESISISGVTGESQELTVLEAEVSLTGNEWQKHPIATGPEAPCILGIDYLRNGYFKDPKGYCWAFGIAAVEKENIRELNTLPGLSDDPSAVELLRVEEQQVPTATTTVHRRQYRTDRDSVIPIHEMIRKLETQWVVSKTHSPFNSPIWPMRRPLGFWSRSYRGSEANYTPTEKEILAAYERVQAASEVIGTETQLLLALRLPVLGWMFKGKVPSTHHAIDTTWSKWIALITQRTRFGNPNCPEILKVITNWVEGENFGLSSEEEKQVTRAEEAPPYNELPETERRYALFTDGSCQILGANWKWKAAVWSPTRQVAQATEGQDGSSQVAELKAVQLALDIAEREKWPRLYLYTDSWMVANALWEWLNRWKKANWQRRGKPI